MASSATLANVQDRFPAGTTVGAYKVTDWGVTAFQNRAGVAPPGSAVATATVTAGSGALAFTGLVEGTNYITGAQVNGVWTYGPQFSPVTGSNGACTSGRRTATSLPAMRASIRTARSRRSSTTNWPSHTTPTTRPSTPARRTGGRWCRCASTTARAGTTRRRTP
jgi:hypothetical protein